MDISPQPKYYSEISKKATYRYRETHREEWLEMSRKHKQTYYEKNKEKIKAKARERYHRLKQEQLAQQHPVVDSN